MKREKLRIYILSDSTGETGEKLILSGISQFKRDKLEIQKFIRVTTPEKIKAILKKAKQNDAMIVYTMAQKWLRDLIGREAHNSKIAALDVLGPVFDKFSHYISDKPKEEPGAQHIVDTYYYRRINAIEFTVKHDDGQNLDSIYDADIVIFGVSRTSKTPLSIYLAHEVWKVANIPFIPEIDYQIDFDRLTGRIVGLVIDPVDLVDIRKERLKFIGGNLRSAYVNLKDVYEETNSAVEFYRKKRIPLVEVTKKSIEETASEILKILKKDKITY